MTARKRRRLFLFAACFALGGVIGWRWGAPDGRTRAGFARSSGEQAAARP